MKKAVGMIEFKTVSTGIFATDRVVKSADIKLIFGQVVCPGKYIALFEGELSAVKIAIETVENGFSENLIGTFVLGNPHENIFPALYGTSKVEKLTALGVFETYDVVTCIQAADYALKTANVQMIELRIAKGMCGKSYFTLTGSVSDVSASIERAKDYSKQTGMYLDSMVIAQADSQVAQTILGNLQ